MKMLHTLSILVLWLACLSNSVSAAQADENSTFKFIVRADQGEASLSVKQVSRQLEITAGGTVEVRQIPASTFARMEIRSSEQGPNKLTLISISSASHRLAYSTRALGADGKAYEIMVSTSESSADRVPTAELVEKVREAAQKAGERGEAAAERKTLPELQIDMPLNTSPALFVLGRAATSIPQASTPREFIGQLVRSVDENGNLKTSLAGEISAYRLLRRDTLKLGEYQKSHLSRLLANTAISFATPTEKSDTASLALGVQTVWLDQLDDARNRAFPICARSAYEEVIGQIGSSFPINPDGTIDIINDSSPIPQTQRTPQTEAEFRRLTAGKIQKCYLDAAKTSGFRFSTGLGTAFASRDSSLAGLKRSSTVYWTTGSYTQRSLALNATDDSVLSKTRLEVVGHARWHQNQIVGSPAGTGNVSEDSRVYGAKVRFSDADQTMSGLLEYSKRRSSIAGFPEERLIRKVAGVEFRVGKDLWFFVGSGGETGRRDGKDVKFGLANLQFGSSSAPSFQP